MGVRDQQQTYKRLGVAGADLKGDGAAKAGWSQAVKIIEFDHQVHESLDLTL